MCRRLLRSCWGRVAGLSITIEESFQSAGELIDSPSDVGGDNASNTLNMIVTMVASLSSEPLRDEYRIYLLSMVLFAPYSDLTKCFCSQLLFTCFCKIKKLKS